MAGKSPKDKCFEEEIERLLKQANAQGRPISTTVDVQRKWVRDLNDRHGKWMPVPKGMTNKTFAKSMNLTKPAFATRTPDITLTSGKKSMVLDLKFTHANGRIDTSNPYSKKTNQYQDESFKQINTQQGHGPKPSHVIDEKTCKEAESISRKEEGTVRQAQSGNTPVTEKTSTKDLKQGSGKPLGRRRR